MSVQTNQYLAYGYMLDYKKIKALFPDEEQFHFVIEPYFDSAFNSKIISINEVSMLIDVYEGKYLFFGKIFAKSNNQEFLETLQIPPITLKLKKTIGEEKLKLFGDFEDDTKPNVYLITHYR